MSHPTSGQLGIGLQLPRPGEQLTRENTDTGKGPRTYDYTPDGTRLGQRAKATSSTAAKFRPYETDAQGSVIALEDPGLAPGFGPVLVSVLTAIERVKLPRMQTGYLGLGSNVGDRRANLQAAVAALPARGVAVLASSSTYDTDPVGEIVEQPAFLNACVRVRTELDPEALLDACKAVERALGREAGGSRHGPRAIDVDLLLLGDLEHVSERLTLPHEQVLARRFVLIPLLELDFDLATPAGERLADALAALPVDEGVRRAGPALALNA